MRPDTKFLVMRLLAPIGGALVLLSFGLAAEAGQCRSDSRVLQIDANQSARFRELTCRLDNDPSALLRVQFQRLEESAAGVLLNNGKAPWTQRLYGKVKVLENPVLKEYRTLVQRFATAARFSGPPGEGAGVSFGVAGPNQPEQKESTGGGKKVRTGTVETVTLPLNVEGPLVDEILHILKQPTWPTVLNLTYGGDELGPDRASLFENLRAWRYLTRADIDQMEERLKRYNALVVPDRREYIPMRSRNAAKSLQLLRYLAANGLPEQFRHFSSPISGDGCLEMNFSLNSIKFDVDVAFLHNSSQKPTTIDAFTGAQPNSVGLRPVARDSDTPAVVGPLTAPTITLQPGETLIVPLRLTFRPYESDDNSAEVLASRAESAANTQKRYQRIQDSRPGSKFQLVVGTDLKNDQKRGKEPNSYVITKTRESFTPHSEPVEVPHAFGPEWSLTGIGIGGETLSFDKPERDSIHFTVDGGAGSCPILYAWSEASRRWERHGKIIHTALTRANAQTEIIRFDGWVPRFLIAEEELEVANLEKVHAVVRLEDGTIRDLVPVRAGRRAKSPRPPISLYSGEEAEFGYALPEGVDAGAVAQTWLIVTGYYDRYSALLTSRVGKQIAATRSTRQHALNYSLALDSVRAASAK